MTTKPPRPERVENYYHQDYVQRPDGARIYFQVWGNGPRTVVLNDGVGCAGFAWMHLLPRLAASFRVVHWHYRGHGVSTIPPGPFMVDIGLTVADLVSVLDATGTEEAAIVGHSMGVQVALELHRQHRHRVTQLALLCGSPGRPLETFHDSTWLAAVFPYAQLAVERFPGLTRRVNELALGNPLTIPLAVKFELRSKLIKPEDMVAYFEHLRHIDPVVFVRTVAALAAHSATDHLEEVDVPTLVVGGDKDRFTPAKLSGRLARAIPGAELLMVPGGTHCTPVEAPDMIWERLSPFLARGRKGPPPGPEKAAKRPVRTQRQGPTKAAKTSKRRREGTTE
jgi:pimeloyl-ACP methyl ester carboxylesterase